MSAPPFLIAAAVLTLGCADRAAREFGIDDGRTWTYVAKAGFQTNVETTKVMGRTSVAGASGYRIDGPLGSVRLGVRGETLLLAGTSEAVIRPPLPIAFPPRNGQTVWHGRIEHLDRTLPAGGKITSEKTELDVAGRREDCVLTIARLQVNGEPVELRTWTRSGLGIVQQEQRTAGVSDYQIKLLRAPEDLDR